METRADLRKNIQKIFIDFIQWEHWAITVGKFDYEFLEKSVDDVIRLIRECGDSY